LIYPLKYVNAYTIPFKVLFTNDWRISYGRNVKMDFYREMLTWTSNYSIWLFHICESYLSCLVYLSTTKFNFWSWLHAHLYPPSDLKKLSLLSFHHIRLILVKLEDTWTFWSLNYKWEFYFLATGSHTPKELFMNE